MKGTFEGTITKAKWSRWDDEQTNRSIPVIQLTTQLTESGKDVYASLFFDTDLVTHGNDAGKSRVQCSLEILQSYGLDVNPLAMAENDPKQFGPAMVGKNVSVYCDEKDGKTRAFLNRRSRPELSGAELDDIWAGISGKETTPNKMAQPILPALPASQPAAIDSDDDLVF